MSQVLSSVEEFASFELLSSAVIPCACHLLNMAELSRNCFLRTYLLDHSWIWGQLMLLQLAGSSSHSSLQCQSPFSEGGDSNWFG